MSMHENMKPDYIICDLCEHPLSMNLAKEESIKCLWCGDMNDVNKTLESEWDQ